MDRKKLIKTLVTLVIFIFVVHVLASKFYWYYSIWYFDMPMHFLGGFWSGLFIILLLSYKNLLDGKMSGSILKIILGVLLIGISWEIFEFSANSYFVKNLFVANRLDSVSDIFFDLSGGLVAILYYFKSIVPSSQNKVQL